MANNFWLFFLIFPALVFSEVSNASKAREVSQNYSNIVEHKNYLRTLKFVKLHIKEAVRNGHFNTIVQLDTAESYTCEKVQETLKNDDYMAECTLFCPLTNQYGVCQYSFVQLIQVTW